MVYKVTFVKPIKTMNDLYSKVKQAYIDNGIPVPYPAANKQFQSRLVQFFAKEKLLVLPIDEEIEVIVSSFIRVFEQTGYIVSASKCHKRLDNVYAISNKRILIVQRTKGKFIIAAQHNNENEPFTNKNNEIEDNGIEDDPNRNGEKEDIDNNGDDRYRSGTAPFMFSIPLRNVLKTNPICNRYNFEPSTSDAPLITRSKAKSNKTLVDNILNRKVVEPNQKRKKTKVQLQHH